VKCLARERALLVVCVDDERKADASLKVGCEDAEFLSQLTLDNTTYTCGDAMVGVRQCGTATRADSEMVSTEGLSLGDKSPLSLFSFLWHG
jgi:hypothetical protein